MKNTAENYRIMQFGFTFFISEPDGFHSYPFNIYLYPADEDGKREDLDLDSDTANFHRQHNFDFKKWKHQGIEYVYAGTKKTLKINEHQNSFIEDYLNEDVDSATDESETSAIINNAKDKGNSIFTILSNMKVPIVGHNVLSDLLFLYSHFCNPLPELLGEFKSKIKELFPQYKFYYNIINRIYDTMIIFNGHEIQDILPKKQAASLEAIYDFFKYFYEDQNKEIILESKNENFLDENNFHTAGFDSYITGMNYFKFILNRLCLYKNAQMYSKRSRIYEQIISL